ncbi:tetratricopeptide repeat-containing glycosyltransferase family protein [Polynucleobacter sp. AP-Sanab-80-C2]|uniref:tetratricopeptide repeat-containing glycosyltransferase family protein n=1 Tax=Polynucleobacter sp. AP-Sanab-80-C2 TaxID=3108274 RepID=UPI002B236EE2|nr:tetratricopeptide repeat-containing glycosyltransferase family protein [Polynucleobacter sp. AP-Sanab-80-C2]MEA9599084.1 tetratricopeptide repeat-containing glycosyltransferase family protein [Polynucleobacter sp. AP-Sanab-80-C2]
MSTSFEKAFIFHQQGEIEQAKLLYEDILQNDPNHFDALHMLGVAVTDEDPSRAVQLLSKALEINSTMPECFNNAAHALMKLGQHALALECCRHSIALEAGNWTTYANAAEALRNLQRQEDALVSINAAISIAPTMAKLYSNRGNLFKELGQHDQALLEYQTAIELDPEDATFYVNRGLAYQDLNLIYPAIESQEKAIALDPQLGAAHDNLAKLYLLNGNLQSGWGMYHWRWKGLGLTSQPLKTSKPKWQNGSTAKRLLVWAEQGASEHILFGSLLLEMQRLVPNLLVQIDPRLIPIFERSMPEITFYSSTETVDESLYDAHIALGDLPGLFRNQIDDFLNVKLQYLKPKFEQRNLIKETLTKQDELLIGIAWKEGDHLANKSSKPNKTNKTNNIELTQLVSSLNMPGIKFVNLQQGISNQELADLQSKLMIQVYGYEQPNHSLGLDDLAALISACDIIISVDNEVAHLAGAMNIPCWVLLPKAPHWRWLSGVTLSPWYPSLRLYRQEQQGVWDAPLDKIRHDLVPLLKQSTQYN